MVGDTSEATNDGQATCGSSLLSADVWFKYVAGDYGYVSADTFGSAYDTVLSVHTACPGTLANEIRCNDDAFGLQSAVSFYTSTGDEYWIRVSGFNEAAGTFLLNVGPGGGISGKVTATATGDPLPGGWVEARNAYGYYEGSATTGASGEYTIAGLEAGSYFLTTENFDGYVDELYDDLPCPGGGPYGCELTDGTLVQVTVNTTTTGISFELDQGGVISGQVTESATADPLPDVRVEIYDSGGSHIDSEYTDAAGSYSVAGLVTGSYFASAEGSELANELYDDVPCPGGAPYGCDPTAGTPIAVSVNSTTPGIDFVLDRLGAISGTVTDVATGDPISGVEVQILDSDGDYAGYDYTMPPAPTGPGGFIRAPTTQSPATTILRMSSMTTFRAATTWAVTQPPARRSRSP